jgi:hypothetical protein
MDLKSFLLVLAAFVPSLAFAQTNPPIEQLAGSAALIVHGQVAKTEANRALISPIEVWKGALEANAFLDSAPSGQVPVPADLAPASGECVIFYGARTQVGGKYGRPTHVLPIVQGKIAYAEGAAAKRDFTTAAFRAAIQASLKNPLVNGGFDQPAVGEAPSGWKAAYPNGAGVIANDEKDTFLRLTSTTGANAGMAQVVAVSQKATSATVLGRMRGKPRNEKEEKRAAVEVALRYLDAKGGSISAAVVASESSPNWRTFRREFKLPPGCTQVEIVARSIFAVGTFDFDEVRVEFR